MKLGLSEILNQASQQKTNKAKAEVLQQNDTQALRDLLQYALHPEITWDLPETDPPYRPSPYLDQEGMLFKELRRLYLFVNGNGSRLKPAKVQSLFIEILESIAPRDAELLLLVKNRTLPKGITKSVIDEAFPGLLPNEQNAKVPQE